MREGIRLRWGLRVEEIPMDHVLWIHPASDLTSPLPLPWLRLPGSLLGKRQVPGGGIVEFLAGGTRNLVFIATQSGGFAVSPSNPERFIETYQRITELGSLSPVAPRSVYPSFLLYRLWADWPARFLLLGDFLLSLALLAWVSLSIPAQNQVHFSFYPNGSPGELVPSGQLILIPILNFFFLMIDLLAGLFFFRRDDSRFLAYLLWSASAVTTVLFLLAVFFILRVS